MKAYTNISQSKQLAEILPIESADFGWNVFVDGTTRILPINDWDITKDGSNGVKFLHAWSLAALRACLPSGININGILYVFESHNTFDNEWVYEYKFEDISAPLYSKSSNEIDACYEMILKLHEQKIL